MNIAILIGPKGPKGGAGSGSGGLKPTAGGSLAPCFTCPPPTACPTPRQTACTSLGYGGGVTLSDPSDPLEGTEVFARGPMSKGTLTTATGEFALTGLKPGWYRVTARREGYKAVTHEGGPLPGATGCSTAMFFNLEKEEP